MQSLSPVCLTAWPWYKTNVNKKKPTSFQFFMILFKIEYGFLEFWWRITNLIMDKLTSLSKSCTLSITISVPRMTCTIYFKYSERAIIKRSIPYTKKVSSIIHVNPQSTCYHKKVWSLKKYYWLWDVKSQTNHQDTFCFVKNIQRNIVMHSFKTSLKAEH